MKSTGLRFQNSPVMSVLCTAAEDSIEVKEIEFKQESTTGSAHRS